jgi:hypothetical protein
MTRLTDLLDDAIGHVEPQFDASAIRVRVMRRRRHRLARRRVGAVAIVALVVVPVALFLTRDESGSRGVRVQPASGPRTGSDVVMFDDTGGVSAVDFGARTATHYPLKGWRPGDQPFLSLRVGEYFVAGWGDVYATPVSGGTSRLLGRGVFVPAVEPGAVWLTSYGDVQTPTERLVDMHGRVLLEGRTPHGPSGSDETAITGAPGGLVLQTATGLGMWDARTGRVTRHLGTGSAVSALPVSGSRLAWCDACNRELEITNLIDGTTRSVTVSLAGGFLQMERFLAFSPDGKRLAIPAQPDAAAPIGATTKIVIVDVTAGRVHDQIDTHARYATVAWSPDSKRIYIAASNTGSGGRVLVHAQSTNTTRDLGPVPVQSGSFSTIITPDLASHFPNPDHSCALPPATATPNPVPKPCRYTF